MPVSDNYSNSVCLFTSDCRYFLLYGTETVFIVNFLAIKIKKSRL